VRASWIEPNRAGNAGQYLRVLKLASELSGIPDNSEAQFKTLKYRPDLPDRFGSIEDARRHCQVFFAWYNDEHRHSGLGLHTAADVHYGLAEAVRDKRAGVLDAAYAAHPERFVRKPPNRRRSRKSRGSTDPTNQRRTLSKYRATVPHSGCGLRLTSR